MADSVQAVPLNLGLDLSTPPLMVPPGSLIDCLNYEMTDTAGYRRIDGYELYDGYPNGDINEFYRITLSGYVGVIPVGTVVYRETISGGSLAIGIIIGVDADTSNYSIVAYRTPLDFVLEPALLGLSDGIGFMLLSNSIDFLEIQPEGTGFTENFFVIVGGVTTYLTADSLPVSGSSSASSAQSYLNELRNYSALLRANVQAAPGAIAGLYWFDDRLLAAIDTLRLLGTSAPTVGTRVRWNGVYYRVLATSTATGGFYIYLQPIGIPDGAISNVIQGVDLANANTSSYGSAQPGSDAESSTVSPYAYLGYYKNPDISTSRGIAYLTPGQTFNYDLGNLAGTLPPNVTLDANNYYWVTGTSGTVLKVKLTSVTVTSGTFNTGNAVGTGQIEVVEVVAGTVRDYLITGDQLHSVYPTTGSSRILTLTSDAVPSLLAGTVSLDLNNTRYVWDTYNFYGQDSSLKAYGATGASKSFWADKTGYGTITALPDATRDIPKYVSFHASKLALGFSNGSVLFSVVGEPFNFEGFDGALEIATGDTITGLLELPGDTLAVFGRKSVRKITGTTDADTRLGTISGSTGAFDYTAALVGADAVFAGLHGVSTLEQTASYGDFAGKKLTSSITPWLRPKLASTYTGFELGGAACAFVVRSKNQYRLVLRTGEVVVITFNESGPKITFCKWHTSTELPKIPYAWSSEISKDNKEKIHVRWQGTNLESQCFQLDSGWGFNGLTFNHYFDTSYIFNKDGAMNMGIEKIRMYGQGHGVASLNIKSSGVEDDFNQPYHDTIQDISMPATLEVLTGTMRPVTSIIDQANWGLGIKLRVQGSNGENTALIEPAHTCQVLVLHIRTEGATDA